MELNFALTAETWWGDSVVICGNVEEAGNWQPERAFELHTDQSTYPVWNNRRALVCYGALEFKVVILRADGTRKTAEWEPFAQNRVLAFRGGRRLLNLSFSNEKLSVVEQPTPAAHPPQPAPVPNPSPTDLQWSSMRCTEPPASCTVAATAGASRIAAITPSHMANADVASNVMPCAAMLNPWRSRSMSWAGEIKLERSNTSSRHGSPIVVCHRHRKMERAGIKPS